MQSNHERVYRFISDEITADSVRDMLLHSFMKKRDGDVYTKAAQMMAIDMLHEAWKEIELVKKQSTQSPQKHRQVGL